MTETATKTKTPNYTEGQENTLRALYAEFGNSKEGAASIVKAFNEAYPNHAPKSARSVISKLSQMGVWEKRPVVKAEPKDTGPTKKELLTILESLVGNGFDATGLQGATKDALTRLIDVVKAA